MDLLQAEFFGLANEAGIGLKAWALFPNHYHFIARVQDGFDAKGFLRGFMVALRSLSTVWMALPDGRYGFDTEIRV